jgi:putative membrane protein
LAAAADGEEEEAVSAAAALLLLGEAAMKLFSEKEKIEIEAAVKDAESLTSGEIVPVVVATSADYSYVSHWLALGGLVAATILIVLLPHTEHWLWQISFIFGAQAGGWLLLWAIGQYPPVVRALAGKHHMNVEVQESAMASFLYNGLNSTRDRTGILVFVSMLEHQVHILADEGIHAKLDQKFWDEKSALIAAGIARGEGGAAVATAIRQMGDQLAKHFPIKEDDQNELPNTVRDR